MTHQPNLVHFLAIHAGIGVLIGTLFAAVLLLTNTLNLWSMVQATDNAFVEIMAIELASVTFFTPLRIFIACLIFDRLSSTSS